MKLRDKKNNKWYKMSNKNLNNKKKTNKSNKIIVRVFLYACV